MVSTAHSIQSSLLGAVCASPIRASSAEWLNEYLHAQVSETQSEGKLAAALSEVRDQIRREPTLQPMSQQHALRLLVSEEIESILPQVERARGEDLSQAALARVAEDYARRLGELGVPMPQVRVFIVETLPTPYENLDAWVLACDMYDEKVFGIPSGVYLRADKVTAYYSRAVIAHEMIHLLIGVQPQDYLARGLEEGIADFFQLVLAQETIGTNQACNILLNSRIEEPQEQLWRNYSEALRQVLIYLEYGLDGMVALLGTAQKEGREAIKRVEAACLKGDYDSLNLPRGSWDRDLQRFARLLIGYPSSLVVSPLAYCLARSLRLGMSEQQAVTSLGVTPEEGMAALKELQERCYLILVREGSIVSDETKMLLERGVLRYEIPG